MPLTGVRVLDLSDHAGALCSRLLADLGADVVRIEPPGGAPVRFRGGRRGGESLAHLYDNANKRCLELGSSPAGRAELRRLAAGADVVVDALALSPAGDFLGRIDWPRLAPGAVVVQMTPFGAAGPRAHWRGSDLVCAARGGLVFINGFPEEPPLAPFGQAAWAATALVGAVAALAGLAARDRTGRGAVVDLSAAAAAAGLLEHATGLLRQTGRAPRRQGTLHWSRTFRIGRARDGFVLLSLLGDWTTLSQWVASECTGARALTDSRWNDVDARKAHAEWIFDRLDAWLAGRTVAEACEGARLRRLPFADLRPPDALARDPQLRARGFGARRRVGFEEIVFPSPPARFSACRAPERRLPRTVQPGDVAWPRRPRERVPQDTPRARPLDGVLVLDFTWVVAGPVATRILGDHGARVVKVEHPHAPDFGTRRGGLTGNLNRGKESVVIDMETRAGRSLARALASRADVVIDNFSARVMEIWGLDHETLRSLRPDVIQVRITGFGLDGPARDQPSYGPTLQALVGYPHLMPGPGGAPAGWGYSWSDMAAGWMAALATLAALRHRERTGEGQLVDLSQLENLVSLMGPRVLDFLAGRPGEPEAGESDCLLEGIFRCAPEGSDDDRWIALSVADLATWRHLGAVLAEDGESLGALAPDAPGARERIASWARRRRAEEIEERLQERGIAAGLAASGADLEADPQLAARRHFATVGSPDGGRHRLDGLPFSADRPLGCVSAPGPLRGEHTDTVLSGLLGLGEAEIRKLRQEEVIG